MKKAFTLIELLVVIAIIAILAAILFPVFAQAKTSAKKTVGVSNTKQIATAMLLYTSDNDDQYPRNDDCVLNSGLNPIHNGAPSTTDPRTKCLNSTTGFAWRMNHFSWQKWVLPYTKSVDMFFHHGRGVINPNTSSCPSGIWSQCGQLTGSYALNFALTGQLNTFNAAATARGQFRNSWLGGSTTAVPDSASAMLIWETGNPNLGGAPIAFDVAQFTANSTVYDAYPAAIREIWMRELLAPVTGAVCAPASAISTASAQTQAGVPDPTRIYGNGLTTGYADGHAKFISVGKWLASTPTAAEYVAPTNDVFGGVCGFTGGTINTQGKPNTAINFPFWALTAN